MNSMQEQEIKQMLEEAKLSVQHSEEVVQKYEAQVGRFTEQARQSMRVQNELFEQFEKDRVAMLESLDDFEKAAQEWAAKQVYKAIWGIFKGILGIFMGNPMMIEEGLGALEVAGIIVEIIDMMDELIRVFKQIKSILDSINGIDPDNIGDFTIDPTTDFMDAIQTAADMKLKGPVFDNVEAIAQIKLGNLNAATDYGIVGADDTMMAFQKVSDGGQRLVDEVGS